MSLLTMIVAAVCSGISWSVIGFKPLRNRSWPPIPPDPEIIAEVEGEQGVTWFHRMKNRWVKRVRRDAEWYGKFLMFIVLLLYAALIAALVM
jgi:hypothetical protein